MSNNDERIKSPLISEIYRGSSVDGPGIRTVVFFKGCPLRCMWCHNPELQEFEPETMFSVDDCQSCVICEPECNFSAKKKVGVYYPPEMLAKKLIKYKSYYQISGGGVTFSGGEPLLFLDYIKEVAELLKTENIHITVETCGHFNYNKFNTKLADLIDMLLFDIKIIDSEKHKKYTGVGNEMIIENLKKLLNTKIAIETRTPLIPNITATKENLKAIQLFLIENNIQNHKFLEYNPSVNEKLKKLGRPTYKELSDKPFGLNNISELNN